MVAFPLSIERVPLAVNSLLPDDIVVKEAWEADEDFSARHSAKAKNYIYRIQQGATPNPLTARYAWYERRSLDLSKMQAALDLIKGTHDFSAFRAAGGAPMSPVRTIYEAKVEERPGDMLEFTIYGNGFLYHMVRNALLRLWRALTVIRPVRQRLHVGYIYTVLSID